MRARAAFVQDRVRAKVIVQARVRPLTDQPVVHGAQYRAVGVRVIDDPVAAGVRCAQQIAGSARQLSFEKTRRVEAREPRQGLAVAGRRFELVGARDEGAEQPFPVFLVHAEHGKGIGMSAADDGRDRARLCRGPLRHHQAFGTTFQISLAYSRIVRSEENQPTRDVLRTAARHHEAESRQRSSTRRWVVQ